MFFGSEKKRVAKAIQEISTAICSGGVTSAAECSKLCSNEGGASWLYTEAMIHGFNSLTFAVWESFGKRTSWASQDFLIDNMSAGIRATPNIHHNLETTIMRGLDRLNQIPGDGPERYQELFRSSAQLVSRQDQKVNDAQVCQFLMDRTNSFFNIIGAKLGIS